MLAAFLRWRHARTALQLPLLVITVLMILDGLVGPQLAPKNLATVLTWVYSRGLIALALLVAGNLFCLACPFMLVRQFARRFLAPRRPWPRWLRHKWLALALFVAFLYVYELANLWATPWWTAWLLIGYFAAAVAVDSIYRGASFCKYVCPLGQFNFVASTLSPLEIKVRTAEVCAACRGKECIRGGANGARGCELALFQERKFGNLDCTFCLDCIHACPYDNVGFLPRLPASELWSDVWRSGVGRLTQRVDLAALVVVFTFGALLNAFGMVTPVYAAEAWLAARLGTNAEWIVLGCIFVLGIVVAPLLLLGIAAALTRRGAGLTARLRTVAARYSYALAPLGLGIWLGHGSFHLFSGFWTIIPVVHSALRDLGAVWLGRPRWEWGPLFPMPWLFPLELGFLLLGGVGSLLVAQRLAANDVPQRWPWAFAPWAILLTLLLAVAIWLLAQPMEMRATFLAG